MRVLLGRALTVVMQLAAGQAHADALADSRDLHDTISTRAVVLESLLDKVDDANQTAADIERLVYAPTSKREKAWTLKAIEAGGADNPYQKFAACAGAASDFTTYVVDVQHALRTGAVVPDVPTQRDYRKGLVTCAGLLMTP